MENGSDSRGSWPYGGWGRRVRKRLKEKSTLPWPRSENPVRRQYPAFDVESDDKGPDEENLFRSCSSPASNPRSRAEASSMPSILWSCSFSTSRCWVSVTGDGDVDGSGG